MCRTSPWTSISSVAHPPAAITGSGIAANTFHVSNGGTSNLTFQSISAPVPATPSTIAPVPTLGGWSTMLLSGLLGTLLYRRVRRLSVKGEDKEVG
ncbi:IPTL-CTERM sorting domain-containing protein [Pseudomonas sp. GWSMS-1]|uniref:IPTL-CTERM sorting domain-containing protein n=1 Tax=Pseudomonas sp. GWSMS-1 TaxID=3308997 RepID=UPI003CED70C4